MSSLEKEQENYKKLCKLAFQVGLSVVAQLFLSRYSQNHGNWEDTPEFGEKLLKMLDSQNNIKISVPLSKYGRRNDIKNGKVCDWDYKSLWIILKYLNFGHSSSSNRFENENKGIRIITQVRNKIAHDYWKEERIPTEEFLKLWTKIYDACLYLGAETEVMDNIMESNQNQNNSAALLNDFIPEMEGKKQIIHVNFPPPPSKPIISSVYQKPLFAVKTFENETSMNYMEPHTFLPSPYKPCSVPINSSSNKNKHFGAPQISSPIIPSGQTESPSGFPVQTSSIFGTLNTTEKFDQMEKGLLLPNPTEKKTAKVSFLQVLLMLCHGIFLLVVSSLFLSRLMQHSEDSPLLLWKIFTLVALVFGSLKIVLSLFGYLSMILKDAKTCLGFNILFGLVHGFNIILFGVLVIWFVLTNQYSSTFLNRDDVEGRKNYNFYIWLISALSAEAGLVCVYILFRLGFSLFCCIQDAVKKCL